MKYLTEILPVDFNNRYEPAVNSGRVRYTGSPDLGFGNRYTGVHRYFFVASLLDLRTRDLLSSDDDYNNSMMMEHQHCLLKKDVVDLIFARVKETNTEKKGDQENEKNQATKARIEPLAAVSPVSDMHQLMW